MTAKKLSPLAKRIRKLRLQAGLTRAEAAAKVLVSATTWADWERGRRRPETPTIKLIEMMFGATVPVADR